MSTTDLIPALKPWLYTDHESLIKTALQILDGIEEINELKSDFFSLIPTDKDRPHNLIQWLEQYGYSRHITATLSGTGTAMTFSGYLQGAAISADSMRNHIQVGTMLMRDSDGLQVVVTGDVDYSAKTATVAEHGYTAGGSPTDDSSAITWNIISRKSYDDDETHTPKALDSAWKYAGTQIFSELFKYGHTWKNIDNIKQMHIQDKVQYQIKRITENIRDQLAGGIVVGSPVYSGGVPVHGNDEESPSLCGAFDWPRYVHATNPNIHTYKNMTESGTANPVTAIVLDNLVYHLKVDEGAKVKEGNWTIVCDPTTRMFISRFDEHRRIMNRNDKTVGYFTEYFLTANGDKFPIMEDEYMRKGTLGLVDINHLSWGWVKGDKIWTQELAVESRMKRKQITGQAYGCIHKLARQCGFLYGMPTTFA